MKEFDPNDCADPEGAVRRVKEATQDVNMGLFYTVVGPGLWDVRCNKCHASGNSRKDRPFPHKLNCPMRSKPVAD